MKKLLCILMAAMLALAAAVTAGAEEDWIVIGSGSKSVLVLVKVLDNYVYGYEVKTDRDRLLDALEDAGLVQGAMTAQGYAIDKVDGFKGRPEENGAYWTVQTYSDELQRFHLAGEDLAEMGTEEYTAIAFVRSAEAVPYEEKMIYMLVQDGSGELCAFEIMTEDQDTVAECLLENGLIDGEESSWGFYVTEAAGIRADYDKEGEYWDILVFDPSADEFVYMEESLAGVRIADLPSMPEMAGYAFILRKQ